MRYPYSCSNHEEDMTFEISAPIAEGPPSVVHCPVCNETARRIYNTAAEVWHTQGAHKTDYDKHGDRLEQANKAYMKEYREKPPPPAKDVPRNLKEPY